MQDTVNNDKDIIIIIGILNKTIINYENSDMVLSNFFPWFSKQKYSGLKYSVKISSSYSHKYTSLIFCIKHLVFSTDIITS